MRGETAIALPRNAVPEKYWMPSLIVRLTFAALAAVGLYAQGNTYFPDHPGKATMIVETSNTPRYGLKPAEAAAFHANLARLRDLLMAQEVFHPARGVEVRGYIRADHGAPVVKTAPVPGFAHVIYYPFVNSTKNKDPFPIIASPWEIEIFFNAPGAGLTVMNLRDPAKEVQCLYEPKPAGEIDGFPVYRDDANNEFIVLSSTGKPAWVPLTREEYVKLWIRLIEEDAKKDGGQALTLQRLRLHQEALARMSPEERVAQARYGGDEDNPLGPSLMPFGRMTGIPFVKPNGNFFDPSRPRTDLQLIVMRFNWRGDLDPDHPEISEYGNAAGLRLWETLHHSDWKAISAALGGK